MRILAIDTALEACAAAVLDTERGAVIAHESVAMARGHAEALMPLIARVMEASGSGFDTIDRFAVTVGPGSFTGLRVGISAARGFAVATGKPAIGLTTLAAFAAPLIAEDDTLPVVAVIDARHEHVYLQVFGPGGRTLVPPRVASLRDALRAATTSRGARLVGTGAAMLASAWPTSERPPRSVEQLGAPDIDWIAHLGAAAPEDAGPPKPLYLKPPDAQPQEAALIARR
jgi:tRNA threonylcarbamoyl adenosine modification protein YeaZ